MTPLERLLTNYPLVNILFALTLIMGMLSYSTMPREQDPEINFNWVSIITVLPGASTENVEELVTGPLEDSIRTVKDIRFVSSTSREGISNILVRFRDLSEREFDKRMKDIRREIQNKANDELPEDADDPNVMEITTSSGFPTALVVVAGQADDERLRQAARAARLDLQRMPGVSDVLKLGLHEPEIHVQFEPAALAARRLTANDLADSLARSFRDVSAGTATAGREKWSVQVNGTTADIENLAQFRVAPAAGSGSSTLAEVARVERSREEPAQLASFNGRPAVSLSITKVANTNTLELIDRVNAYIETQNRLLAGNGITLFLADDQTVKTRQSIKIMQTNALLGLSLVLLVCWAFLGLRIASFVTLGIAFSIAATFWLLHATGNTLNVAVLLGVVIVLGMLVDDAVVVVEAIYYRLQRGAQPLDAATQALREVAKPVASAVATTMAAFLPLMLLPGILGDFMFVIPFVVTVGLSVSLVEAFWFLPSHLSAVSHAPPARAGTESLRNRITRLIRLKYTRMLVRVMRRPALALAAGVAGFVLAIGALGAGLVKIDFFTDDPIRLFYVNLDLPPESTLDKTLAETVRLEAVVRNFVNDGEARAITSLAGIKFTEIEPLYGDQYGQIQVSLAASSPSSRSVAAIVDSMRDEVVAAGGDADISFTELSGGPPLTSPINVKVRADDFEQLRLATDAMLTIVREQVPGAYDIADDDISGRPELVVVYDHAAIRRAGLDPGSVARLVRLHTDGEIVAFMRDSGEKVELRVRAQDRERNNILDLLDDPVALPAGGTTTLGSLVAAETRLGRGMIRHYDFRRTIAVTAELDPALNNTVAANKQIVAGWQAVETQFPGVSLEMAGELDDIQESMDAMGALFLMGVGLMYLILATQFRSYFQPFFILATVPLAFTGVVLGLVITQNPLSLYSMYGIIALTGIAVNSAIVLIDAANARMEAGMRTLHATIYAARRRVVPIIMTTTTTIAGLLSLALGLGGKSLLWGPVASSIVAGLAVATPMTLFIVPILYRLFMRGRQRPVKTHDSMADWL